MKSSDQKLPPGNGEETREMLADAPGTGAGIEPLSARKQSGVGDNPNPPHRGAECKIAPMKVKTYL